jgi:cell shape-determining protein MreD
VTLADYFKVFTVKPDLILISMVVVNLLLDWRWAFALSVFAGMLKDILCVSAFGTNTLIFALWSFLIIKLSRKISLENICLRAALMFVVVFASGIAARPPVPAGILLRIVFLEAVYAAILLPLVCRAVRPLTPS